jgi:hypothetical protein
MGNTGKLLIGAAVVVVAGWLYASPYLSVNAMKNAALENDAEGITGRVDFPALKESIKGQFTAKMSSQAGKSSEENPLADAGAALGMMMIGPMIDAMVTPEAVTAMMRGRKLDENTAAGQPGQTTEAQVEATMDTSMGYRDLNTFEVTLTDKKSPSEPMTMLFKRHGIANWKLTAVEMPL